MRVFLLFGFIIEGAFFSGVIQKLEINFVVFLFYFAGIIRLERFYF